MKIWKFWITFTKFYIDFQWTASPSRTEGSQRVSSEQPKQQSRDIICDVSPTGRIAASATRRWNRCRTFRRMRWRIYGLVVSFFKTFSDHWHLQVAGDRVIQPYIGFWKQIIHGTTNICWKDQGQRDSENSAVVNIGREPDIYKELRWRTWSGSVFP